MNPALLGYMLASLCIFSYAVFVLDRSAWWFAFMLLIDGAFNYYQNGGTTNADS